MNPDAQEDCSTEIDDNCDTELNTPDALNCTDFYADEDGDGYAGADSALASVRPPRPMSSRRMRTATMPTRRSVRMRKRSAMTASTTTATAGRRAAVCTARAPSRTRP